ncbi:HEAT repeat domain-containing protein [Candidatus Peregrinibacteria bacterium]|nr:MAG: HEAT repeat domain-containing protein [Candidatus Peregrinibacteria bacterium]
MNSVKKFLFGNTFLSLSRAEWGRVIPAFFVKLFFQVSFLSAGTVLLALFVDRYGIYNLSTLFIFQAAFIILGTAFFTGFLRRAHPSTLVLIGVISAAILLILSAILFLKNPFWSFFALLIALCVFLMQVSIWLSLYIENLFSPLEGERAFPILESAEPIGGIFSGILLIALSGTTGILETLVIIGVLLCLIPPALLFSLHRLRSIPVLRSHREERAKTRSARSLLQSSIRMCAQHRFLMSLGFLVFLQYFAVHFLEFQFTSAVDHYTRGSLVGPVPQGSYHYADNLVHSFGSIQIGIFSLLLLLQLLLASTILRKMGVVRTYAIAPLFALVGFLGMTFHFGFLTAIFAKMSFETGYGLGRNAFLSSFYALSENIRDEAREALEGIARPLGILFGTILLVTLQFFFSTSHFLIISSGVLVGSATLSLLMISRFRNHYTQTSRRKLENKDNLSEKMDAIEILSQPGHRNAIDTLSGILFQKDEVPEVRVKTLQVIGRMGNVDAIPAILSCFRDSNPSVCLEAVRALGKFKNLGQDFFLEAISRYSVQQELKELFVSGRSTELKIEVMKVLANFKDPETIPFLLRVLRSKDPEIRAECVSVFGLFHDISVVSHLQPLLSDVNPKVRARAIATLWQYPSLRLRLVLDIHSLLESSQDEERIAGMYCVGEVSLESEKKCLYRFLYHRNDQLRRSAAIALAKMNDPVSVEHLVNLLFHQKKEEGLKTKKMLGVIQNETRKCIDQESFLRANHSIMKLLQKTKTSILENLREGELHDLLHIFHLIDAEREVCKIRMVLNQRALAV